MSTDLNTIYSWFEEGDYPTAQQFQATFSSFYHKSENIPLTKIEGLNNTLGKYVLTSSFNSHLEDKKAHEKQLVKLDASNITEEYRTALRAALGVGDLPSNIATTDYVDQNAKNVANSLLKTQEGAGIEIKYPWFIDANGNTLQLLNLNEEDGNDLFDKKLVLNHNGEVGLKEDSPQVQVTIPDELTINNAPATNVNYTVNHVYPDPVPELGEEFNNLKNFMTTIANNNLIELNENNFNIVSIDNDVRATVDAGVIQFLTNTIVDETVHTAVFTDVRLPNDKNWLFSLKLNKGFNNDYSKNGKFGFVRNSPNEGVVEPEFGVINGKLTGHGHAIIVPGGLEIVGNATLFGHTIIYTKVGRILNISVISESGETYSVNIDAMTFLGDYRFVASKGSGGNKDYYPVISNMKYYIEP